MDSIMLVNGKRQNEISASDRGFQYGDGLFETIEILNGQSVFFQQHLQRLQSGCKTLLLPCPDLKLLANEVSGLSGNCERGVLKIMLTRGSGGRGYRQPEKINPTRVLSLHPYPDYPPEFQQEGIRAIFCRQRLGLNPTLAGLKHLNRLEQVLARAEWKSSEIQEGLMLDINGHVIEGTMSNVFFVKNSRLFTPDLEQSGIAGIMRGFVLETAKAQGIASEVGNFDRKRLLEADEVFMTNSVVGIWPVRELEQTRFKKGQFTQQMQAALLKYKQQFYESHR